VVKSTAADSRIGGPRHGLEMHPGERADDFHVTQLFGVYIHEQILAGPSQLMPSTEYGIAATSSPFAPPHCSSSLLPKRGSGGPTRTVNMSSLL
jgi:hypothetical protein